MQLITEGFDHTYIFGLVVDTVENCLEGRVGKTRLFSRLFVVQITCSKTLRAEVKGITEGLMDTSEGVGAGHEDLRVGSAISSCDGTPRRFNDELSVDQCAHTLSNAVEHARGCVATKMGFVDILCWQSRRPKAVLLFQDLPAFVLRVEKCNKFVIGNCCFARSKLVGEVIGW